MTPLFAISSIGYVSIAAIAAILCLLAIVKVGESIKRAHKAEQHRKNVQEYREAIAQLQDLKGDYLRTLDIVQVKIESGRFTYAELGITPEEFREARDRIILVADIRSIADQLNRRDPQCLGHIAELHSMIAVSGLPYEFFGLSVASIAALELETMRIELVDRFQQAVKAGEAFCSTYFAFQELLDRQTSAGKDPSFDPDLRARLSKLSQAAQLITSV